MPKYFFDVYNGHGPSRDDVGLELSSDEKIKQQTTRILLDIARDELPGQDSGEITIVVRDAADREICATRLSFKTEWRL